MVPPPQNRTRIAALILSCVGLVLAATSVAALSQAPLSGAAVGPESASDALARYLRVLAGTPRDFQALIGAGRAALELGDTQAAAGFFGRADEVWPTSPLPQIGMGAATALDDDPQGALAYFQRAERLGARPVTMGADRGLAYDLLGRHAEAQADYRAALAGASADEARRRLALSLAITRDKAGALEALGPLLARRDTGAIRARALVLALTGDQTGARQAIEWSMPGGWSQMAPFLSRLNSLSSAQQAAAVHLGVFPGSGQPASGGPLIAGTDRNRLADIDALLRGAQPPSTSTTQSPVASVPTTSPPVAPTVAATSPVTAGTAVRPASPGTPQPRRFWVQLASGPNPQALPELFRRSQLRSRELLDGKTGYVADDEGRARLLVGPFRNAQDARIFAEDLAVDGVRAFSWVSSEGQVIRKITTE
ncbi:hypothetical protein G7077_10315 [Sphingomonas piscis]|uniref:SPOR domain-containing protein n=1 Tax=Sphingomonas piscis TaxID=2714943 RepID=A0A6G7YR70_9SPHN|nr:hypothetical protein [Sphingomonas piscis]QIK79232.1 hypothetical protein G7077_10315 [Sphingomonas piscis]